VDRYTLEVQNQFVYDLLNGKWDKKITGTGYAGVWDEMCAAETAAEVARIFNDKFEKGDGGARRELYATQLYEQTGYAIRTYP
jgi:hypothetical protein